MGGNRSDPRSLSSFAAALTVAAAFLALAIPGGSSSDVAMGSLAVIVWLLVLVVLLAQWWWKGTALVPASIVAASLPLVALTAFTGLSLGWGVDDGAGFVEVVRWVAYLGLLLLAGLWVRSRGPIELLIGLAIGGTAIALIALGSRLLGIGGGDADLVASIPGVAGRLSYPIGYWNGLGAVMALTFTLLVWVGSHPEAGRWRAAAMAAATPVLVAAYMTSSRGAVIAAVIGSAIVVSRASDRRRASAVVLIGAVCCIPGWSPRRWAPESSKGRATAWELRS